MVLGEGFGGHGHGFNFERSDDAKIRNVRPTFYFKVVVEGLVFRFDAWAFSFRGMFTSSMGLSSFDDAELSLKTYPQQAPNKDRIETLGGAFKAFEKH